MINEPNYFDGLKGLRERLNAATSPGEFLDREAKLLSDPAIRREFMNALEDPHWLTALRERSYFANPPGIETTSGGRIRCAGWPESGYLKRIASRAPDQVGDIFRELRTDNWTVVTDMVNAAGLMPVDPASRLSDAIGSAISRLQLWYLLDDVGAMVARWAKGGQVDAALELFQIAFAVDRADPSGLDGHARDFGYFKGLREDAIPALAAKSGLRLMETMLPWLRAVVDAKDGNRTDGYDLSYVWRPAIEDHEQNRDFDFAAKLVGCVRDACQFAISTGGVSLDETLKLLMPRDYLVERRLGIHLTCEFADANQELARRTMLNRELFDDYGCKHEYARLLELRFGLLSTTEQHRWLEWVDLGPGPTEAIDDMDESTAQDRREYWSFQRLCWIRPHLIGTRLKFFEQMFHKHGRPELADFNVYSGSVRVGHESPLSLEQLSKMDFERAAQQVSRWQPTPGSSSIDGPSLEGLREVFRQYVASDTGRFSAKARLMIAKPPCFVRAFIEAVTAGIKEGVTPDMSALTDLGTWVVARPIDEDTSVGVRNEPLIDHDWLWCRDAIAELAQEACNAKDETKRPRFDLSSRERLWGVIKQLPQVPPTTYVPPDEEERDPRTANWPLVSLNSSRGKAMHAVFAYANWVADHHALDHADHQSLPKGFDSMPEVRTLLEEQLSRNDRHFTETAVFGWKLGDLYRLDLSWLEQHVQQIFDLRAIEAAPSRAFGWAAWNSFLLSHRPHKEFYRILRDQYGYAVKQAKSLNGPEATNEQPFARLAEHLMVLFGRGDLGALASDAWNADNGLIRQLVTTASKSIRSHAVEFVGQSLHSSSDTPPPQVPVRFTYLWEKYWEAVGKTDASSDPASRTFGSWFSSGAFDARWSLQQLEEFVTASPKVALDRPILEHLSAIFDVDPLQCARILGRFVDGDDEGWRIMAWKDPAKQVLMKALLNRGTARDEALRIIDRLGRRGFIEFGELLSEPNGAIK